MLEEATTVLTEKEMVKRAQRGDVSAFEAIYREYQPRIAGYLRRLVGNPDLAADLTQDAFVNAYRGITRTQPGLNLRPWLFTIASNIALSHHRRQRLVQWLPLGDQEESTRETDPQDRCIAREDLTAALAQLPRDQAACLTLRVQHGFTYEEIGGILGISAGAARTRACRARLTLARALQASEEGT